ncbi:hypothetical protein MRX96_043724 [Rhipicephalus microplus]
MDGEAARHSCDPTIPLGGRGNIRDADGSPASHSSPVHVAALIITVVLLELSLLCVCSVEQSTASRADGRRPAGRSDSGPTRSIPMQSRWRCVSSNILAVVQSAPNRARAAVLRLHEL